MALRQTEIALWSLSFYAWAAGKTRDRIPEPTLFTVG
jgi:hypothetical protein